MSDPILTIVIPTHNGSGTIARAVGSAVSIRAEREIVVVDDGSDAHEKRELEQVLLQYPDVTLLSLADRSGRPARPRNEGVRQLARGAYLLFLDDDDELIPRAVESHLSAVIARQASLGVADIEICRAASSVLASSVLASSAFGRPVGPADLIRRNLWPIHSAVIDRRWFDRIGGFDERLPALEDWHLFVRLVLHGASYVLTDHVIGRYHPRPSESSRWQSERSPLVRPMSKVQAYAMLLDEFPDKRPEIEPAARIARRDLALARLDWVASRNVPRRAAVKQLLKGVRELSGTPLLCAKAVTKAIVGARRPEQRVTGATWQRDRP